VQGIGYPNPNRSHFTSMDIWQTADPRLKQHEGWLGRYFDACCTGADAGLEPIQGVALMKEAPPAMQGDAFTPLAFDNPDALTWRGPRRDALAEETFRKLNNVGGDMPETPRADEQFLQRAALEAQLGADEIRKAAGEQLRGAGRGGQLGRSLQLIARMIAADLPTRVYYVSMGGFDTHTGQVGRHQRLMRELGDALKSFADALQRDKLLERVLAVTFSEFGRRVQENASGGTDHGEAGPMFVVGSEIKPGVHEQHPDLAKLHRGDLAFGCDFRRVYATILRDWLDTKPEKVLGPGFPPLRLIAG